MKVAQICTNVMSGSVGSIVRNLCDELKKDKHEYLICYGRGNAPLGYNYYKFDNKLDIYSHVIFARLFDSDGLHSKRATLRLIKKLKAFKPDVVHIHCLHGYYINYPLLFDYFRQSNIKVIWTMHDCWAFTGHCCNFEFKDCQKWKKMCNNCIQKKSYPKSYNDKSKKNYYRKKQIFNMVESCIIVTPSKWLSKLLADSFLNDLSIEVIPNGINVNNFKPTYDKQIFNKYNLKKDKKNILCVAGIWDKSKGIDDIIELANIIDDSEYQLIVVGKKNKKNILPENIISIDRTDNIYDLACLYTLADVFFNPTYDDNYPTVNLEAIACGTPVVTYGIGGSGEIIKKTGNGIIINKKNYHSLIQYLDSVYKLDYYNTLTEQKNIISKELMCSKYIKLYKK